MSRAGDGEGDAAVSVCDLASAAEELDAELAESSEKTVCGMHHAIPLKSSIMILLLCNRKCLMSDQIKQIQATYQPIEDRILFQLHTQQQQCMQAWITRRYLKLLIPALQGQHPQTGETIVQHQHPAERQLRQEKAQLEGDFEKPYEEPENLEHPLGDTPILLAKMTFRNLDGPEPQLALEPDEGAGIQLGYNPELMGVLLKVLSKALTKADWSLDLEPILDMPDNFTLQ